MTVQKNFNHDVLVQNGASGVGKLGYTTGAFLGGLPIEQWDGESPLWDYRGKAIMVDASEGDVEIELETLTAALNGTMLIFVRSGVDDVTITPAVGNTLNTGATAISSYTLDSDGAWVIIVADYAAESWAILSTHGRSHVETTNSASVELGISGTGTTADPYSISAQLTVDPSSLNLLGVNEDGAFVGLVTGAGLSGTGTDGDPLTVSSIAITNVHVVANIAARDILPDVDEGDVAKVLDDGDGKAQTYIFDGEDWVTLEDRSDVTSVNGQTGNVELYLEHIMNVYITEPNAGEVLTFDGDNWVNMALPVTAHNETITINPGVPVEIEHNLGVTNVVASFRNTATDEYESVWHKRQDNDSILVDGNIAREYGVRIVK